MVKAHPDIETNLAYSEKLHGLTIGYLQETSQLLKNIEQLQGDTRMLLDENNELREEIASKDACIAELKARVAQQEARPNIVTDNYFEHLTANQVITLQQSRIGKRAKIKKIDNNQLFLELWKDKPTAIL